MVDTISRELLRGRSGKYKVSLQAGIHNLHNHLFVRKAHDESVFRGVVFVLRLGDQPLAGIVCKWGWV